MSNSLENLLDKHIRKFDHKATECDPNNIHTQGEHASIIQESSGSPMEQDHQQDSSALATWLQGTENQYNGSEPSPTSANIDRHGLRSGSLFTDEPEILYGTEAAAFMDADQSESKEIISSNTGWFLT